MSKLQDTAAIITGATSGMGRATAVLFAREGAPRPWQGAKSNR